MAQVKKIQSHIHHSYPLHTHDNSQVCHIETDDSKRGFTAVSSRNQKVTSPIFIFLSLIAYHVYRAAFAVTKRTLI